MDPCTIAKNVSSIFSMPDVALRINVLINLGETKNSELEQVILHDPALTAKILKLSNSVFFGFPGKIDTISRAVSLIGYKGLHNLVIATSVASTFDSISSELVDMETFWYHSVTCGVVANHLAIDLKRRERERFFIAGLLHAIGKLILFSQYPKESEKALKLKEYGDDAVTDAEREIFGFTYVELGAEFLKQWQLPQSIWRLIESQADPLEDKEFKEDACILHIAVTIANCIQPCANQKIDFDEINPSYKPEIWNYVGLNPEVIRPMIEEANTQVFEMLSVIRPEATMIF